LVSYRKELAENRAKVDEIRASDDHSMLKQWENVALETQTMIPDSAGRLRTAVEDLELLVEDSPSGESSTPEFKAAVVALADAAKVLQGTD
jgi:Tubulin binding cofactor A